MTQYLRLGKPGLRVRPAARGSSSASDTAVRGLQKIGRHDAQSQDVDIRVSFQVAGHRVGQAFRRVGETEFTDRHKGLLVNVVKYRSSNCPGRAIPFNSFFPYRWRHVIPFF